MARIFALTTLALACAAAHAPTAAAADLGKIFSFNGFATFSVVHSNEDKADFVGSPLQPDGAGYSHAWDIGPDTKLAGQMHAAITEKFSATLQVIAQHAYDDTYTPAIEWANLKYQVTDDLDVRVGRVVLPMFMFSESRNVGYASAWIRPPLEVYVVGTGAVTNNDGIDVTYRSKLGGAGNSVQAFYGSKKVKLEADSTAEGKKSWGINDTLTFGDATLRLSYNSMILDLNVPSLDPVFNGLRGLGRNLLAFGFTTAGNQSLALAQKYRIDEIALKNYALGASYDPGKWFAMTEVVYNDASGLLPDTTAWYIHGGYRVANFTPYATYSSSDAKMIDEPGISTAGLPGGLAAGARAINAGVDATLVAFASAQHSVSVGVRWDFMSSAALKVQYDRLSLDEGTAGHLTNAQPGFQPGNVDLVSIAVDFVF